MRHVKIVLLGLILSLTFFSSAQVKPAIDRTVHFEISESSARFDAKGGTKTFSITASDPWKIKSNNASWCTLKKEDKLLTVTAKENVEFTSRSGFFVLECESKTLRVDVVQKAAELYLSLSTQELSYEASGGTKIITVATNGNWNVGTNNLSWIHLSKDGNELTVRVDSNPNATVRNGSFNINAGNIEKRVIVSQKFESISLSLSQQELSFDASGGARTITVTSNHSWSISTGMDSWGHLTQEGNTLKVRVDANQTTSSRTDWFEIKAGTMTKRVNVTQQAALITLSLSSQELTFEASGGTKTITVTTNGTWSIGTDLNSWGHLTKDGNTLRVRLDANSSSSSRTDWFTIKAGDVVKRVNVTQKGEIKPSATITSITQSHNQPYNMYTNCMKITVKFETSKLQNKRIYCYAYFYGADNVTPLHTQFGNQVSTSNSDTAPYEYTTFTMTLVMSYLDLNMAPGFSGYLTFDIVIKDSSGNVLARQDNNSFSYTRGWY